MRNELRLVHMEYLYYAYRIRNPKYDIDVESDKKDENSATVATGVLNTFREQLHKIVLSNNVPELNKWQAINILIGQDSYKTLYDIARDQNALKNMLNVKGTRRPIAFYIVENFPEGCDHYLLNLAYVLYTRNEGELLGKVIDKLESPKTLLTLCMFLRNNPQHSHQVNKAVERIGIMVMENLRKLARTEGQATGEVTNEQLIKCLESLGTYNSDNESAWIEPHEKSMLISAHKALETIVLIFGEDKITAISSAEANREMKLVQKAINSMVIEEFIENLSKRISNTAKKSYCTKRTNELKIGEVDVMKRKNTLEKEIDCLLSATDIEADQRAALRKIYESEEEGLCSSKFTYLVATLNGRLQKRRNNEISYPPLEASVAYEFCKLYRLSLVKSKQLDPKDVSEDGHEYKPMDSNPAILQCIHCNWTKTNEAPINNSVFNPLIQGFGNNNN